MATKRPKHGRAEPVAVRPSLRLRRRVVLGVLALGAGALVWRAVDSQVLDIDFLQSEGERRFLREVEIPAQRGTILDRNGEALALSTPVSSVWANPRAMILDREVIAALGSALGVDPMLIAERLTRYGDRGFVYLARRIDPAQAERVRALKQARKLDWLGLEKEYRRYYPGGEVFAHLTGLTGIDDQGLEGLELAYDDWLQAAPGRKRVIKDGQGRILEQVENIEAPRVGRDLVLSLDRRLQYLAYRELKAAVTRHQARAGSLVLLDVASGEVLALVNQPSFNPNAGLDARGSAIRNRAITDAFEPGSTIKPLTVAAALEAGTITPTTEVETGGLFRIGRQLVRDHRNYGTIDIATVLQRSSNIGASKIALGLEPDALWSAFDRFGIGRQPQTSFPGEAAGQLPDFRGWSRFEQATLSFGYHLAASPLQLAQAYAVLAADGLQRPVSLLRLDAPPPGERVLRAETARTVRQMLEGVVGPQGTARAAAVPGYRVAGKTGTVKKYENGGYAEDKYLALFAGIAPAGDPRLIMIVVIDEPRAGKFYGGDVAAPLFSKVMAGALRQLNVAPDAVESGVVRLADLQRGNR